MYGVCVCGCSFVYSGMFIRQVKKQRSPSSKIFYQYSLVQAERIDGKVKQRVILYLGSDPLLRDPDNRKIVLDILKARIFGQPGLLPDQSPAQLRELAERLYEKYRLRYQEQPDQAPSVPTAPAQADYQSVDINSVANRDVRTFGAEHLCSEVIDKLELKQALHACGLSPDQITLALMSIISRALFGASEHKTAALLAGNSCLAELMGCPDPPGHKQLYGAADRLWEHRQAIDGFLDRRLTDLFGLQDRLVIFDISNTYFETRKQNSRLADWGRSKERRSDCPLVVFTGVVNTDGFIRHWRIYEGNKADSATLPDMLADLQAHSPACAGQTVVIDAGIATDENLELIRSKGYDYVCVSRKRLADYTLDSDSGTTVRFTDRQKNRVELCVFHPPGETDTWMYVQSEAKKRKETSMQDKLRGRFEAQLQQIRSALDKKGGTKTPEKVWERIGRAKEKYRTVSSRYQIKVEQQQGKVTSLHWSLKPDPAKEDKSRGVYFVRTSYSQANADQLWQAYNTIRQVEATFRCLKSDLNLRPVYHQKDERIESHIYLTILAYQLVNTIRYMLKQSGIHYDWNNIRRIMNTQILATIELPTETKRIQIRKPSIPDQQVQEIYKAAGCTRTRKPIKKSVVYH